MMVGPLFQRFRNPGGFLNLPLTHIRPFVNFPLMMVRPYFSKGPVIQLRAGLACLWRNGLSEACPKLTFDLSLT